MLKARFVGLVSMCFAVASVHAGITAISDAGQIFRFKFELNKPLIYTADFKKREINDAHVGQRSSLTRTTSDIHYKIKLMATRTNHDGTTTVLYEPFDYEQDVQAIGPNGEMDTTIRGLEIISKENGVVMIDSAKGIGMSQVEAMKDAAYPHLLSGYFDFEANGNIKNIHGDLPFVDHWRNILKDGTSIFYITFPTNAIAVQDAWTNYITLKTADGVTLNDAFVQPWVFSREPDSVAHTGQVAHFALFESDIYKDAGGYLNQFGQQTSVAIPQHAGSMNASFRFDQKRGCLISMEKHDVLRDQINMMVQGNPSGGNIENETDVSLKLISP